MMKLYEIKEHYANKTSLGRIGEIDALIVGEVAKSIKASLMKSTTTVTSKCLREILYNIIKKKNDVEGNPVIVLELSNLLCLHIFIDYVDLHMVTEGILYNRDTLMCDMLKIIENIISTYCDEIYTDNIPQDYIYHTSDYMHKLMMNIQKVD